MDLIFRVFFNPVCKQSTLILGIHWFYFQFYDFVLWCGSVIRLFILASVFLSILFACLFFFLSVCLSMSLSAVQSCSCNLLSCLDGLSIWPAYQLIINTGVRGWRAGGEVGEWGRGRKDRDDKCWAFFFRSILLNGKNEIGLVNWSRTKRIRTITYTSYQSKKTPFNSVFQLSLSRRRQKIVLLCFHVTRLESLWIE